MLFYCFLDLIVPGEWFHLALVWIEDSSKIKFSMYVNGKQYLHDDKNKKSWNPSNSKTWDIGGTTYEWKYGYFLGYVSDLMVFNSALSSPEIGQAMGR